MPAWIFFSVAAAIFAAATTIFAKIGLGEIDSHLVTALRTSMVIIFLFIVALWTEAFADLSHLTRRGALFLFLSGLATGGAWLSYFRALQLGTVNQVVPIDKSSTILTIFLALLIFREPISPVMGLGIVLIAIGTYLMIERKAGVRPSEPANKSWIFFAVLAAAFSALTAIFGRIGMEGIHTNLGTFLRTIVVIPLSWTMVAVTRRTKGDGKRQDIGTKSFLFILLSAAGTAGSWLFFYHALQIGPVSLVVPIDKLSIVVTMLFARIVLRERFTRRAVFGLALLTIGTLLPLIFGT